MEVGEALPPPGEKPIKGEFDTIKTTAAQYMVEDDYEHGIPVQASASGASINLTDDDYEVFNLLPPGSETGTVAESAAGPESTISPESINTSQPLSVAPTSKRMVPVAQAPHWFLGSLGTDISASSPSITPTTPTTLDTLDEAMTELSISASVSQSQSQTMTTSVNTNTTGLPGQRGPVSFNAWGPEGEQMRRVKQPTIATEESGWKTVTRTSKGPRVVTARPPAPKEQVRKGGWVKTNNRRTVPTLPDYLKYDTFDGEGDYTGDSPEEN
ncbi:hypothetical protein B0T21DRAFT_278714 [Apiosordaria backusii]|uniref:Uncharacterized protein n=1 Tax=Apiosordaria backusii TaxID=314023 RepID=A0AA40K6F6_9PEZI|nr:hypothetical protein B0T21DRAFT_278714 [Apiosordaria backusii]